MDVCIWFVLWPIGLVRNEYNRKWTRCQNIFTKREKNIVRRNESNAYAHTLELQWAAHENDFEHHVKFMANVTSIVGIFFYIYIYISSSISMAWKIKKIFFTFPFSFEFLFFLSTFRLYGIIRLWSIWLSFILSVRWSLTLWLLWQSIYFAMSRIYLFWSFPINIFRWT